jgi:hypothetical protein
MDWRELILDQYTYSEMLCEYRPLSLVSSKELPHYSPWWYAPFPRIVSPGLNTKHDVGSFMFGHGLHVKHQIKFQIKSKLICNMLNCSFLLKGYFRILAINS